MRLRQVALVAEDLEAVTAQLGSVLGIDYGYHDPGIIKFGLDNWVAAIGDTFLEVVSPVQDDTTAGRYLERRGGDGGYMVILQVPNLESAKQRLEEEGARIVWNATGRDDDARAQTEGAHVHPKDCGGAILSLDESRPKESWVWAGPSWHKHGAQHLQQICGVEVQSSDPEALAARWAALLGQQVRQNEAPDGRTAFAIDFAASAPGENHPGAIRFVEALDDRGPGVSAVDVLVTDEQAQRGLVAQAGTPMVEFEDAWACEVAGIRIHFLDRC